MEQNLITFDNGAAFIVNSSLDLGDDKRCAFEFTGAKLCLPPPKDKEEGSEGNAVSLPPFGKGWFDTLYLDDRYRLARDSRDDILLVESVGEPEFYE